MNFIIKQFFKEEFTFTSHLSAEELENKFREACKPRGFRDPFLIAGKIEEDGSFKFFNKSLLTIIGIYIKMNVLHVKVLKGDNNGCSVEVITKGNLLFGSLAIFLIINGIRVLLEAYHDGVLNTEILFGALLSIFLAPCFISLSCYIPKRRLINRFTETFYLKPCK